MKGSVFTLFTFRRFAKTIVIIAEFQLENLYIYQNCVFIIKYKNFVISIVFGLEIGQFCCDVQYHLKQLKHFFFHFDQTGNREIIFSGKER